MPMASDRSSCGSQHLHPDHVIAMMFAMDAWERGMTSDASLDSIALTIPDVRLLVPKRYVDERGFFSETWNRDQYAAHGVDAMFVQDNHSFSRHEGTLRGFHFQRPPLAQGKLVRVVRGMVLDVVVDLRMGSPTFRQSVSVRLSADAWNQLWVPPGFAHAFLTLSENVEFLYKVTAPYSRDCEAGIRWDDPALAIDWPIESGTSPMLSAKDATLPLLREIDDLSTLFPYGEF
jgi:dTDP-4-dehydrorhamnose 3,5-epimerase